MRLLLDTHVLLSALDEGSSRLPAAFDHALDDDQNNLIVSVASLWEIGIKVRQRKLRLRAPLDQLAGRTKGAGIRLIDVTADHALHEAMPVPPTKDPFDRLLLAVADLEGARLLTVDSKLVDHPLAWRPEPA